MIGTLGFEIKERERERLKHKHPPHVKKKIHEQKKRDGYNTRLFPGGPPPQY
jgi:hypothetical protein